MSVLERVLNLFKEGLLQRLALDAVTPVRDRLRLLSHAAAADSRGQKRSPLPFFPKG